MFVCLFDRIGRSVKLNQFGRVFLKRVENGLNEISYGVEEINHLKNPYTGTVSIAFLQTFGISILPEIIRDFNEQYPLVEIQLYQNNILSSIGQLLNREVDLCLITDVIGHPEITWHLLFDEELFLYDFTAHAETRLTDLLMPVPLQGARDLNMESAYEYGSRVGFWRLMRVFAERQVTPTIYAIGMALERNPRAAETMARQGCDIVDHGWRWLDYHGIDEATEREHIRLSVETIQRLTGTRPIGWYIGTPSANTRRLVVEEGGFLYDSDAYNDELPYWTYDYGRPHLIIPHTLDDNDTRLARGLGWGQAEDFFVSLRDNFDALHREGEQTPKMMTVALHCRLAGKPARAIVEGLPRDARPLIISDGRTSSAATTAITRAGRGMTFISSLNRLMRPSRSHRDFQSTVPWLQR
jgi:peptidoglycan/xylan/chitin deacetylase (PgdA/CDA1 family)